MSEPVRLASVEGDKEKARRYKEQVGELLTPICELFTAAKKEDISLQFSIVFDGMGRAFISEIKALKEL